MDTDAELLANLACVGFFFISLVQIIGERAPVTVSVRIQRFDKYNIGFIRIICILKYFFRIYFLHYVDFAFSLDVEQRVQRN